MRLKNPQQMKDEFAKKDWLTLTEISEGTGVPISPISDALNGKPLSPKTVRALAAPLGKQAIDIATFVTK